MPPVVHHHHHRPSSTSSRAEKETQRMLYFMMTPEQREAYDADREQREQDDLPSQLFSVVILAIIAITVLTFIASSPFSQTPVNRFDDNPMNHMTRR